MKKYCNNNFTTQYAYLNDDEKKIHIFDYEKQEGDILKCSNGHELIMVNCEKRKKHFRHKHSSDTNGQMSPWHGKWQSFFPYTEVDFKRKCDKQVKSRRADIFVENENVIIEIQHSNIERCEVKCRNDDYKIHEIDEVIWVIDGNTSDIKYEEVKDGGYFITFKDTWKYDSFTLCYEYILLDINEKIFKIPVKKICSNMIYVKEYIDIETVIEELNKNTKNIWNLWKDDNEILPRLSIKQKGAGNGKTFDIWKDISINWSKYTNIVITKQHTAKEVIKAELDDQAQRNDCEHISDNIDELNDSIKGKQLIVEYKHKKTNKEHIVIIGTVDSFIYSLSNSVSSGSNFFETLLDNIENNGCDKVRDGFIKYGGKHIKLDKTTELIIDEAQDLGKKYCNAVIKLMLLTKIDVTVVGDLLQSLENKENFMNIKINSESINLDKQEPVNINRRIKVNGMSEEINRIIKFKRYELREIITYNENNLDIQGNPIEIIDAPRIYADKTEWNMENINKYVQKILELYKNEVEKNNYNPNDFLIIFPIMKSNFLACELETKINDYWIEKKGDKDLEMESYAVLHKSEENQPIDTKLSEKATRIMSIRSSKGDGRKVVFVLGCDEKSLKMVSNGDINIIYESHLHVSLTRAKYKIYFGLNKNNDDIHRRFAEGGYVEYKPSINTNYYIHKIVETIDKDKLINILKENGIKEIDGEKSKKTCETVDWEYHCIRRSLYHQFCIFTILKESENTNFQKSQIKTILKKMIDLPIKRKPPGKFYDSFKTLDDKGNLEYFPLCNFSHKSKSYRDICRRIEDIMIKLHHDYKENPLSIGKQTPLEAVIQNYMIDIIRNKNYHSITPRTIYSIVDYFKHQEESKVTELLNESENIKNITKDVITNIIQDSDNVQWNIEHMIKFSRGTKCLDLLKSDYPILGFDKDVVYHVMMVTDFNKLNYWDILINLLLERFLLYNTSSKGDDENKFKGKSIKTYLFILKNDEYKLFDWKWDKDINHEIKEELKKAIIHDLNSYNRELFNYYDYIVKDKQNWEICEGEKCSNPIEFMEKNFKNIEYLNEFYKTLKIRCKKDDEKAHIKKLLKDFELFNKEMYLHVDGVCNKFLCICNEIDEEEW